MMRFLLVAILLGVLSGPGESLKDTQVDMQNRRFHEHYFEVSVNPNLLNKEELRRKVVLFPLTKTCTRPNHIKRRSWARDKALPPPPKPKDPTEPQFDETYTPDMRWDSFISVHHFDVGDSLEDWKLEQDDRIITETDAVEGGLLGYMFFFYLLYVTVCSYILPLVGWIFFHIFFRIWLFFTQRRIRFFFRRIWISVERRKLAQQALLRSIDPKFQRLKRYRPVLPKWMRLYEEEETPAELVEISTESETDESSDGFETEYVTKNEEDAILQKHPQKIVLKKTTKDENLPDPSNPNGKKEGPKKKKRKVLRKKYHSPYSRSGNRTPTRSRSSHHILARSRSGHRTPTKSSHHILARSRSGHRTPTRSKDRMPTRRDPHTKRDTSHKRGPSTKRDPQPKKVPQTKRDTSTKRDPHQTKKDLRTKHDPRSVQKRSKNTKHH